MAKGTEQRVDAKVVRALAKGMTKRSLKQVVKILEAELAVRR